MADYKIDSNFLIKILNIVFTGSLVPRPKFFAYVTRRKDGSAKNRPFVSYVTLSEKNRPGDEANSQVNITSENIATVINNLTSIISTANVTDDQNIDNGNVRTVKTVLAQTASLLRSPVMVTSKQW